MASWLAAFGVAVCLVTSCAASSIDLCEELELDYKCQDFRLLDASEDGIVRLTSDVPTYMLEIHGDDMNDSLMAGDRYLKGENANDAILDPILPIVIEYSYDNGNLEFTGNVVFHLGKNKPPAPVAENLSIRYEEEEDVVYTTDLFNGGHDEAEILKQAKDLVKDLPKDVADSVDTIYYAVFHPADIFYKPCYRGVSVRMTSSE